VRNGTGRRLWFIRNVLDRDFYSSDEAALLVQDDVARDARPALLQYFRDESIRARLEPHTIMEGFVFLPRVEGGRYVDIRLQHDAYVDGVAAQTPATSRQVPAGDGLPWELRFEFALPLPDGDFDYERLNPTRKYAGRTLPDLALDELRATLEQLPCCAANTSGSAEGDPLNVVIVGEPEEVLHALTRAGWS
jgi:hypothetical protein